ncbi:MAG: pentapeptide repeat-containing protein, partial [Nostoc sp.]
TNANLTNIQALETNFTGAILTGACIEDWHINSYTNLTNVTCDYIYLCQGQQERRPSSGNFTPGEFTKLFQKAQETVDLIFNNGIDWQAFLTSFQKLQVECGGEELSIQAIENKNDGVFVIRVNVPADANKAEVEKYLKREYELALVVLEEKYQVQLQGKDEQIEIYRKQSTDLTEIVKLLAGRATYDLRNSQIGGSLINAEIVNTDEIGGNIHNNDA